MPTNSKQRFWLMAIAVPILLVGLYYSFEEGRLVDLDVFLTAGERFTVGEMLYRTSDGHYQFKYMPMAAAWFVPLSALPLHLARFIWMSVIVLSIAGSVILARRLIDPEKASSRWLIPLSVLVLLKFYLRETELGQTNAVYTFALLGMIAFLVAGRDIAAGLLLGLAATIKPYALMFLPYFAVTGRWRPALIGLAATGAALLFPGLVYGFSGNFELLRQWMAHLSKSTPALLTNADNISLFGFFAKWLGPDNPNVVTLCAVGAAITLTGLMLLAMFRKRPTKGTSVEATQASPRETLLLESAAILAAIPLLTPQGWDYIFVTGTLAVMMLIARAESFLRPLRWVMMATLIIIGGSVYDLMGATLYRYFMEASVLTVCYVMVVMLLIHLRFYLHDQGSVRESA